MSIKDFRLLKRQDVFTLLERHSYLEIANIYHTNKEEIAQHVRSFFKNPNGNEETMFEGVPIIKTKGAWMNSQERKYYKSKTL